MNYSTLQRQTAINSGLNKMGLSALQRRANELGIETAPTTSQRRVQARHDLAEAKAAPLPHVDVAIILAATVAVVGLSMVLGAGFWMALVVGALATGTWFGLAHMLRQHRINSAQRRSESTATWLLRNMWRKVS